MRTRTLRATVLLAATAVTFAIGAPSAQQIDQAFFAGLRWRSIGPPRSGYVAAPAGVPGNPNTYYVGLPEGGVWKTTNAGVTWKPIFDDVHIASVGAVAVAPSNPNVVYVGTGNQSGWSFTAGKGVYKSTDAGQTWTSAGLVTSEYIGGLVVDPTNADRVLVAAIGPRAAGGGRGAAAPVSPADPDAERGVYRTTDGGKTWTRVLPANGMAGATDIYMDYQDPQVVYALLGGGGFGAAPQPTTTPGTGAFKSIDGGATWQPVSGRGFPDGARIQSFAVSSGTHGRRLYAVAVVGGGRGAGANRGLYRSDDGGDNWTFGTRALASAGGKIYADPQNPDVMFLMGTSVYRSTDGGRHVASYWGAPSGADPRFLWIDPTNNKRMIAGVDQGAAISVDAGETWTPYYGLVDGQFYRVATDYDVPYHVCGPQQDSGTACVASRSDFGEIRPYDWYPGGGFENGFLIADPSDTRYMYTQGWYHVLRRFDKRTGQVIVLYQPGPEERFGGAPPLAFSPQDPHTLYMASERVLRSKDRGETWEPVSSDLAAVAGGSAAAAAVAGGGGVGAPAAGGSITTLALSAKSADVIWAGTSTNLIQVTKDGGKTWTNVTPPNLPPAGINVIDASHADAGTAYAALLSRDGHPHIYRTANYGQTWDDISSGLRDEGTARVVREDPKDPNLVFAGTVTGIYVSFDRGSHWQPLQLNLPTTVVSDITVKENDLVISTYGRGFWILDDIAPLRQARAILNARTAPFFFTPAPASRIRWDNTQDTPMPPEMIVGENPPEGAILDYYLPKPASSVKLTISDQSGAVIREFTNVAPPPDTTMPNVPEYWIMPPTVLPTGAGMHRVNWDLRYPDPPSLNYGYSGNALEYREYTLNWHAIPGKTYRNTVVGPMVLPGSYVAKLNVDGVTLSQTFTVVQDPRVAISDADLRAQFRLQQRMVAGLDVTFHAITYVQQVREALADRAKGAAGKTGAAQIATPTQALDGALAPLAASAGPLGIAHRDLGRRINDQLIGDAKPTASVIAGVDVPCASIDTALDTLRTLQVGQIAELDGLLKRSGLAALPSWTPPAAPACGAK
jgi:photosystem II stability/assembly factor-like uncharacterized protein